ncbi:uncharacterized protein N7500_001142 [Penicillium coprophilum]|uniref:uncharacterized protein n=1 Tax=Penicillium coprophilum TaxID=36646 RepID=UPI00239ACB57|nr:uncharacterized protein N7500_001142 [Penicillium coprophilum]KAJ5178443.1 hypothetical protein N7500_001142 [Penicillium coprophilum]
MSTDDEKRTERSESKNESDCGKVEIEPAAYVIVLSATTKRMELSRLRALVPGARTDSCYSRYGYQGPYNNRVS